MLVRTKWLPDDSAFRASLAGGPEYIGWTVRAWQGKSVFDALQNLTVLTYRINAGKKAKKAKPATFPTPKELLAKALKKNQKKRHKNETAAAKPTVSIDELTKLDLLN